MIILYCVIALALFYIGFRLGIATSECLIRQREAEIVELREMLRFWHEKYWEEVNDETCRN